MSGDRSFERSARAWLELGPTDPPRRVVDEALLVIETTPQERDLGISWRLPPLPISSRFGAAALVGVIALVGGFLLLSGPSPQTGQPSFSPSLTPEATAFAPVLLQGEWRSVGTRNLPQVLPQMQDLVIDAGHFLLREFKADVSSTATIVGPNRVTLRLDPGPAGFNPSWWPCHEGDQGTYLISLASDGRNLLFTTLSDACAPRSTVLNGEWIRTDVVGLAPGSHRSDPFELSAAGTNGRFR